MSEHQAQYYDEVGARAGENVLTLSILRLCHKLVSMGLLQSMNQLNQVTVLLGHMVNGSEGSQFPDGWQRDAPCPVELNWNQRRYRFDEQSHDVFLCKSEILGILNTVAKMQHESKVDAIVRLFQVSYALNG